MNVCLLRILCAAQVCAASVTPKQPAARLPGLDLKACSGCVVKGMASPMKPSVHGWMLTCSASDLHALLPSLAWSPELLCNLSLHSTAW